MKDINKKMLAFDLGASSGRAMLADISGGKLKIKEIHRFDNVPIEENGSLFWNIDELFSEIKTAIKKANGDFDSIGIDTWGVDYGIIDKKGELRGRVFNYRDRRTFDAKKLDIYGICGIQFMKFNSVYQLMKSDFCAGDKILLIPDLIAYFLTGEMRMEYTNASTTNLLNAKTHELDDEVLKIAGLDKSIFAKMIKPGDSYGNLKAEICAECGCKSVPVIAVGTHDTASAVHAVPSEEDEFLFISSGTWSLLGTVIKEPILSEQSERLNFTNELAVDFSIRYLKNIMGLWIVQQLKKCYDMSFDEMVIEAQKSEQFKYFINPDDEAFAYPCDMDKAIKEKLGVYNMTRGQVIRCAYESLAFKYRYTIEKLISVTNKSYDCLYIIGGGVKNELLCRMTANASGLTVYAGPDEASVVGNVCVQAGLKNRQEIIRNSFDIKTYMPENVELFNKAYEKFRKELSL